MLAIVPEVVEQCQFVHWSPIPHGKEHCKRIKRRKTMLSSFKLKLCAQKWSLECFVQGRSPSRNDVRQLREWLTERVERLRRTYKSSERERDNTFMYAEQVIDVYNSAFHELTRQVQHINFICTLASSSSWRRSWTGSRCCRFHSHV